MPFRPGYTPLLRRLLATGLLPLALVLTGCGGGSSSPATPAGAPDTDPNPPPPPSTSDSTAEPTPEPDAPPPADTSLAGRLDAVLATFANRSGGAAVLVMQDGEILYRGAVGLANRTSDLPITAHTGFRIASISKTFTALAIMQLEEEGTLRLGDSILTHLPELPDAWAGITIEHLLSHRSGIIDVVNDILPSTWLEGYTNADVIAYLISHPELEFPPGTAADYSNTGYILLAEIVARTSGQSFATYLQQNLFAPAGMADSFINDETRALRATDALAYGTRSTFYGTTIHLKGAMAQVSSAEDFAAFFVALHQGLLVDPGTLARMTANPHQTILFGRGYGYGFMLEGDRYGHEGTWDGYQTKMTIDPDTGRDVVVLCSGGSGMQSLIRQVYDTLETTPSS